MKKTYSKPMILIETFSLSTNISAGCEFKTDTQGQGECGYQTRNGIVFMQEIQGCLYHEPDTNDALCYHVPTDLTNIFNS